MLAVAIVLLAFPASSIGADADSGARPAPEPGPGSSGFDCADQRPSDEPIPPAECDGLVELHQLLGGAAWRQHSDWVLSPRICRQWEGVTCAPDPFIEDLHHVVGLNLHDAGMTGDLGAIVDPQDQSARTPGRALAKLGELRFLKLSRNDLTGRIPPELARLTKLTEIVLGDNALTGSIPGGLADLPDLVTLQLPNNQLSGTIPEGLMGDCAGCTDRFGALMLTGNDLSGRLPSDIGRTRISTIDVRNNAALGGPVPDEYAGLGGVRAFMFLGTEVCVAPDSPIEGWLDQVDSVLGPRQRACDPDVVRTAAASGGDAASDDTGASQADGSPLPTTDDDAAADLFRKIMEPLAKRRSELQEKSALVEASGAPDAVDQLVQIYSAWADVAEEQRSALSAATFPDDVQAEMLTLIRAAEREAQVWRDFASDRDAVANAIRSRPVRAADERVRAERDVERALGLLIDE